MGAFQSVQHKMQDVGLMKASDESTPQKVPHQKRLLTCDPRSPSEAIYRTPIVVDKTPSSAIADPRSPTTEFIRTPLNPSNSPAGSWLHNRRNLLPLNVDGTPLSSHGSESGIESADVTPSYKSSSAVQSASSLQSPDSALLSDDGERLESFNLSGRAEDELPRSGEEDNISFVLGQSSGPVAEPETPKFIPVNSQVNVETPRLSNAIRLRGQMTAGQKVVAVESAVVRSPLSQVANSPRISTSNNPKMFSSRSALPSSSVDVVDKENISH